MEQTDRAVRGLEFDGLAKRYGHVVALDGLSFDVRPGVVFGFVGSNGAGKTTAMRIALGVLEPDGGEVRWNGRPVTLDTRRRIGYMPEERGLYPKMRVGEQLAYLAQLHAVPATEAWAAARRWTDRLGVGARIDDDVQKLSLGNQQRVQLAAALVHDPDVLILDEPFSGLDPIAVDVMSGVLREKAQAGVPVIFSSHQLDLVERLCDRVGIVQAGRMVAVGTVADLRGAGPRRVVVVQPAAADSTGSADSWVAGVPGARPVARDGERLVVELSAEADDQRLLQAALRAGPVHEFAPLRPSLVELYRHVVTAGDEPAPAAVGPDEAGPDEAGPDGRVPQPVTQGAQEAR